jgi:uncharacterized protein YbjT (DUF2867 family)
MRSKKMIENKKVLVFGATGNIGGAATRELLKRDWRVRAVTRSPESESAVTLSALGAEVVRGDMEDRRSLEDAFDGICRVLSVQNWVTGGIEGEKRQGKLVADIAHSVGIEHLVYGSSGTGDAHTGIPHFNNKLEVEAHMRALDLPFTIVRPAPFMELLSEKEFFPMLSTWGVESKIIGWDTPSPWVAVRDIGIAVANIFEDPERWIGKDISLFGDVKTLRECKEVFVSVDGKKPFGLPIPIWLFQKMANQEIVEMWRWLDDYVEQIGLQGLWEIANESRKVNMEMLDLESWLKEKRNGHE